MATLTEQLRRAMAASGKTNAEISRATGIQESVLSRFNLGAGLRSESFDALGAFLGVRLVGGGKRKSKKER